MKRGTRKKKGEYTKEMIAKMKNSYSNHCIKERKAQKFNCKCYICNNFDELNLRCIKDINGNENV